jgi:hypothetical protein
MSAFIADNIRLRPATEPDPLVAKLLAFYARSIPEDEVEAAIEEQDAQTAALIRRRGGLPLAVGKLKLALADMKEQALDEAGGADQLCYELVLSAVADLERLAGASA